MSAIAVLFIGLGLLTLWSGFNRVLVTDLLRSIIGAQPAKRNAQGQLSG